MYAVLRERHMQFHIPQTLRGLKLIWLGDSFAAGDVLLEIETDKAQMDVEAQDDGILAKIIVSESTREAATT